MESQKLVTVEKDKCKYCALEGAVQVYPQISLETRNIYNITRIMISVSYRCSYNWFRLKGI